MRLLSSVPWSSRAVQFQTDKMTASVVILIMLQRLSAALESLKGLLLSYPSAKQR